MGGIHYKALDGLRALAVLIVLLAHGGLPYPRSGGVGVDIFFVLSGFLITGILSHEAAVSGTVSLKNFYARRILRLTPCLLLTCLLVALLHRSFREPVPGDAMLIAVTYTANWAMAIFDKDLGMLGHCWSLSIEEQYYLFWPWVILALEQSLRGSASKCLVLGFCSVLVALYRLLMTGHYSAERIYYGLDTHIDGILLGSALHYGAQFIRESGGLGVIQGMILGRILVPLAVAGIMVIMELLTWVHPWMSRAGFLLVAGASAVVIADLTCNPRSILKRLLSLTPLVWLGKISYGIYLYHYPVFHAVDRLLPHTRILPLFGVKVVVTLVVASLSYVLFEKRCLALKRYFRPTRITFAGAC